MDLPLSQYVLGGAFGGIGVPSHSRLDSMFPVALAGRANSALNVLHPTAAQAGQAGTAAVIAMRTAGPHDR